MKDIVISNLTKSYGEKTVLRDFSACFPGGEVTCLMGPSGCGKTTLLRILLGLETADSGTVKGVSKKLSAVFQEDRLCNDFSAAANLRLVTDGEITSYLTALGIGDEPSIPVRDFSGGMQRRVAIARALAVEPDLLILDEPMKGLDEETRSMVISVILEKMQKKTIVVVTHDPVEVDLFHANLIRMKKG